MNFSSRFSQKHRLKRGVHNENDGFGNISSRRIHRRIGRRTQYVLPVVEKTSFENRPRGCDIFRVSWCQVSGTSTRCIYSGSVWTVQVGVGLHSRSEWDQDAKQDQGKHTQTSSYVPLPAESILGREERTSKILRFFLQNPL